ncbi:MAG TPA: MBL fold metallo-hydrolase, partial [Candidatus Paceibacterota bacterium]
MKFIRIFLLVLIIIGLGLLVTQKMWVPKLVEKIIEEENNNISIENGDEIKVTPISHATLVLELGGVVVYIDPVGGVNTFAHKSSPNLVLVTDIHGDHLNVDTLKAVLTPTSILVVPKAVAAKITEDLKGEMVVLNNSETVKKLGINILAVPMYNDPVYSTSPH